MSLYLKHHEALFVFFSLSKILYTYKKNSEVQKLVLDWDVWKWSDLKQIIVYW